MSGLHGTYDLRLVALSVILAIAASYAALDLAGRIASARGWVRATWLICGAAAMGSGIWAMHYIGMLALQMPMPVYYHVPTVAASLLAAVAASAIALFVVARPENLWSDIAASLFMGGGIVAMHYIGMAAMRCAATVVYDGRLVALSIVLALVLSFAALKLTYWVRDDQRISHRKLVNALVMGSTIPLMHYTGMWAATFHDSGATFSMQHATGISGLGIAAVGIISFVCSGLAITSSFVDRYIAMQKTTVALAFERETFFKTMAEAVPEMIWTADPTGAVDYCNQNWVEYGGAPTEQMLGDGWTHAVHPDDLQVCVETFKHAIQAGKRFSVEFRLRAKDASFRWFLVRANPIRNGKGEIVQWFGACTDIQGQKDTEQTLEKLILERTTQLAEVNGRLEEEMLQKDLARKKHDEEHEQMMERLRERSRRATLLAKMGELLQSCMTRDEAFAAALGYAPKIFPAVRGAIAVMNQSRSLTEVIGSWTDCILPVKDFDPSACWALRTGQPHLVAAGDTSAPCAHAAGVKCTYLCIPILAQGETLGILHVQAMDQAPQLESGNISFQTTFAGQLGLSIANIRLREALHAQSIRDPLTGLYNRRYLDEILERELRRAGRANQSLGIVMMDLDHFKNYNDRFGHDAGDSVLREAAACLIKSIRAEDFVCRFGGEEFILVLPTADRESSRNRAERVRARIKGMNVIYQGRSLGAVTISAGVAAFPKDGAAAAEIIAAADAALYAAKRAGRDRVMLASPPAGEEEVSPSEAAAQAVSPGA